MADRGRDVSGPETFGRETTKSGGVRLFLDSADGAAHARWLKTGLFHGVTTNPTILRRAGLPCDIGAIGDLARTCLALGAREVQAQGWGGTADSYRETGEAIAAISERMVVKLPATEPGFTAAQHLIAGGARVTITAVYAPHHALAAAALGASYVAPYFGRMGDAGIDAAAAVDAMNQATATSLARGGRLRVLVASIRSALEVSALVARGCDTLTFGTAVAEEMVTEPLTLAATDAFEGHARGEDA